MMPDDAAEPYFAKYTALVTETDLVDALRQQLDAIGELARIADADARVLHAPHTWTIADVIQHLVDSERVFAYRALRFARGDETPLPGFDENAFAAAAYAGERSVRSLVDEWELTRRSSIALFASLDPLLWQRRGVASGHAISVQDVARVLVGHARHHLLIVRRRLKG